MAKGYNEKILIQLEANTKVIQDGFAKLDATLEKLTASITKLNDVAFSNMAKRAKQASASVKKDMGEAFDPTDPQNYIKALDKSFTKISQSTLHLSRGFRAVGQVIPFDEMKGLTTLATHLTNTLRGAVYVLVNFNKGVDTLAEISRVTGKSLGSLTGVVLSGFVNSVKTLRELLASKTGSGFFTELANVLKPAMIQLKNETIELSGVLSSRLVDGLRGATGLVRLLNSSLAEGKTSVRSFINSLLMSDAKNLDWIRNIKKNLVDAGAEAKNLGKELYATLLNPKLLSFIDKGVVGAIDLFIGGLTNLQSALGKIDLGDVKKTFSNFSTWLKTSFPSTFETFQVIGLYLDGLKQEFISIIPNAKTFGQAIRGALDIGIANTLDLITKGVIGLDNAIKNFKVSNIRDVALSIKGFFDGLKESFPETIEAFGNLKTALGNLGTTLTQPLVGLKDGITGLLASAGVPLQGILSTGVLSSLAIAIGGVAVAVFGLKNAFSQLANLDMLASFNSIMGSAQEAESFLMRMNTASKGTINTVNIIRSTNLALTEVSQTLRGELIDALPKLLEVATIQARATGDSVDHLFNSLVTGIKRGSSLLIDNTGIVIKIGDATKALADSLGKTVEQLSAEERQLATLNAVLLASDNIIGKLGGSTASTNQIIQKMKVEWQNFGLIAGKAFEPLINAIAVIIAPLNTIIVLIAQNLLPIIELFSQSVSMVVNTLMMGLKPIIDATVSGLQRMYGSQNNLATNIMNFLVPAFDVLGKALYAFSYYFVGIVRIVVDIAYRITIFVYEVSRAVISVLSFADTLVTASGGMASFQQGLDNFNMGFEVIIAQFDRLVVDIGVFIDNSLIGIANWTGMVIGIFEGMRLSIMNIMTQLTVDIASIFMGDSPPPKGALSTIDKGAENVMLAWIDGFTGVSMQPIHNMVAGVSDIVSNVSTSITSFKFIDNVFDTIENRLKALQEQYNNFKQVVDNSFELLNNKQNDLIKYLNMGDQSVLSTIRALDVQKESANELLKIRREQFLLSENELLVMQSQLGMQTAIANVEDNITSNEYSGGGSDTSEQTGTGDREVSTEDGRTSGSGGGRGGVEEITRERRRAIRDSELARRRFTGIDQYMTGYTPSTPTEELSVADRRARRDSNLARRRFTGIDQYMTGYTPSTPTTPEQSLGSRIGDAFQTGRGTGLDFFTPKGMSNAMSRLTAKESEMGGVLKKSGLTTFVDKMGAVLLELVEAFNKLKETGSTAITAIRVALEPITTMFSTLLGYVDSFVKKLQGIVVPDWLLFFNNPSGASYIQPQTPEAMPASNLMGSGKRGAPLPNGGQKTQQTIFDFLSDSIDNLILTLPPKLTLLNGLMVTLFELPMQNLLSRMFGLASPTSILYIFNKTMLVDIPNILNAFIAEKWVMFKEQMVQTFVDLEMLLSRVILYPIIRILNNILSGFQVTMESLAEGLNALIAFYNSLPPSIRGSSEQLQEFSIDKLKFKLIDVPEFAKGGIGSGVISVGEHGQEYVSGSRLAVFPNSYVTATNHLARQLAMVNSTIRGNQQYTNNQTSNVDRSLTANIYTSRFDSISLTQLQAIRG